MKQLKAKLTGHGVAYQVFLDILTDFKNEEIDLSQLIVRAVTLFGGTHEVIAAVNSLLPPQHVILIEDHNFFVSTPAGIVRHSLLSWRETVNPHDGRGTAPSPEEDDIVMSG